MDKTSLKKENNIKDIWGKEYNTIQQCKKCGIDYLRTYKTGLQCTNCRKGKGGFSVNNGKKYPRRERIKKLNEKEIIEIINWITNIERKSGWIRSLVDINILLNNWFRIRGNGDIRIYDLLPPGHQLHYMWKDLLKWKNEL